MDPTKEAYELFAPSYDDFTQLNDYEMWLGQLLPELEKRGLKQGRLLDVGCGTGRAFEPMLKRGWEIVGCDLTEAMLEQARQKYGDAVPLHLADIRQLPVFGEFELVWALNDVMNYLLDDADLERALAGMRANLAPGGLVLFDANTLRLFQENFTRESAEGKAVGEWRWAGQSDRVEPGGVFEAEVSGGDVAPHVHRERHWREGEIEKALEAAGLKPLGALGQYDDGKAVRMTEPPDQSRDHKVIYIAAALAPPS